MESQRVLVDTSLLIEYCRTFDKSKTLLFKLIGNYNFEISVITEYEFLIGSNINNEKFMEALLSKIDKIDLDSNIVNFAVSEYFRLKKKNKKNKESRTKRQDKRTKDKKRQ